MMALDTQLFYALNSLAGHSPVLDWLIVFCASYLAYIVGILFFVTVYFSSYPVRKKWEIFWVTSIASVVSRFGVAEVIRFFYHRVRPFNALPNVHNLFTDSAWSFPSGHATFFFAMATALYFYNKTWGTWFFIAAAVITIGRVAAGVHYPLDIIGGAVIG
ncbi:MAG TPA: phosphatase PAP2 family protein, partial [Candidatus Paceibacterota bacterium]|nr:phosphatase PAP2 family protein [Candidatus Paceibacterota bacterium]